MPSIQQILNRARALKAERSSQIITRAGGEPSRGGAGWERDQCTPRPTDGPGS